MTKTEAQIVAFLNSIVGDSVNAKCGKYQGQCVSEIKAVLEFLGVPNPYAARGNATDCADTLLRQNIAENGKGWLTVVVNHDMGYIDGVHYGHIWIDVKGVANYEQNGARALHVTKNTRPISQGQQFVNLDKWIQKEDIVKPTRQQVIDRFNKHLGGKPSEEQIKHYVARDIRTLYQDILNTGVSLDRPTKAEVLAEFKKYLGVVPRDDQIKHYMERDVRTLRNDLLGALLRLHQSDNEVNKSTVLDYISKNLS